MATDGVKIKDGDLAHTTYNNIMDRYDSGESVSKILIQFELVINANENFDVEDEFEEEVYITTVGLAFWELGILTAEHLNVIKRVVDKNAGARLFGEFDEEQGTARKLVLEDYLKKINAKNPEPRVRVRAVKNENTTFNANDVIVLKTKTKPIVLVCKEVYQNRGDCSYVMLLTNNQCENTPTFSDIKKREVWTSEVEEENGFAKMLNLSQKIRLVTFSIDSKMVEEHRAKFEVIHNLIIDEEKVIIGEVWSIRSLEELQQSIHKIENSKKYSLTSLSEMRKD